MEEMPKPLDSKEKSFNEIEKESLMKYLEKQAEETGFITGGYAWFKNDAGETEGKGTLCYYGGKEGKAKEFEFDADKFFESMGGTNVYKNSTYSELQQIFTLIGVELKPNSSISEPIEQKYQEKIKESKSRQEYLAA